MQVIHGDRGSGKTTKLIQMVKEFGGVLVVPSLARKHNLVDSGVLAKDQVITFQERRNLLSAHKHYWVDQVDMLLEELFGPECDGFSIDTPTAMVKMMFNQ